MEFSANNITRLAFRFQSVSVMYYTLTFLYHSNSLTSDCPIQNRLYYSGLYILALSENLNVAAFDVWKKSLQYFMCNFNKFKDIFIIFGTNHPETPLY